MNSTEMNLPFLIYFILCAVMSAAAFVAMGADKRLAQTHQRRIPEKHLFLLSILFGGIGGTIKNIGMGCGSRKFHHKTKHWYFRVFFPLFALIQIALGAWLFTL